MTIPEIIEHVYTTPNPETGSEPPEFFAWVMFEHGTMFLTYPNENTPVEISPAALAEKALEALRELGTAVAGTASADFNVGQLPWFTDQFVYFITYGVRFIFNLYQSDEEMNDMMVGLLGRAQRSQDAEAPKVVLVRDFTGKQTVMN